MCDLMEIIKLKMKELLKKKFNFFLFNFYYLRYVNILIKIYLTFL
jgi:hypothetical protein